MAIRAPVSAYRPLPPLPGDIVRWPVDFGQRYIVMVDTEEEFDWSEPLSREHRSTVSTRAIPAAARRFADAGAAPIYLVDYPVARDPAAVDCLRRATVDGRAAIGAQLHPWVNPPLGDDRRAIDSFAGNLPRELHAAKLDALTRAIADAFGASPRIFRAGRYGAGDDTMALLAERGYRFDTSMRARFDYSREHGPDYRAIGNAAFHAGAGAAIVELPYTTIFTGVARHWGPSLYRAAAALPRGPGVVARLGIVTRVPLTPEDVPLKEALEAVRVAAGEGLALLNFAFHSPSLEPGNTPYVRDAADLRAFWAWWDAVFALLARLGIAGTTLADIDRAVPRLA